MEPLIGDFLQPLPGLAVHIGQIGEAAQRPEIMTEIADAGFFHFAFFPGGARIAGSRIEVVLAGKSQEARVEANQTAVVLGDHRQ